MKKKTWLIISLALVAILAFSACSAQTTPPATQSNEQVNPPVVETNTQAIPPVIETSTEAAPPAVETSTEAVPAVTESSPELSDEEMEALITEKIGNHHTLSFILSKDFDAEEWSTILDRMIGYGADINPEEKEMIIEWLVNRK